MLVSTNIQPVTKTLKEAPGLKLGYPGTQAQDKNYFYLVQEWDSVEKHEEFQADTAAQQNIKKALNVVSSWQESFLGQFDDDPTPALSAPLAEILRITVKEGLSRDQDLIPGFTSLNDTIRTIPGVSAAVFGPVLGDDKSLILVCGWQSMEHFTSSTNVANVQEKIGALMPVTGQLDIKHAVLSSYSDKFPV